MTVFEAYITNLGKYAEGQLVGETLKFPATTEEVQSLLKNIGVDGVRYPIDFVMEFYGKSFPEAVQLLTGESAEGQTEATTAPPTAFHLPLHNRTADRAIQYGKLF